MKSVLSHLLRQLTAGTLMLLMAGCVSSGRKYDCGFLASSDSDLNGSSRFRAIGPLVEIQKADDGSEFSAFRPFYSRTEFPDDEKKLTDLLWPIGMSKDFRDERFWRFFPAWGRDFSIEEESSRSRFHIFPVFFSGKAATGERYVALFPLGGRIHEFLGRDEVTFALFPLYAHSSVRDVETWDYLWPFVSVTKGDEMERLKIFPFYGSTESEGRYRKRFIMWPFYTDATYDYDNEKGSGFILFPFYGHAKSGNKESWMVLPPFFRYSLSDTQKVANMPYPFFQYSKGDIDKLYVWPLWGWKESEKMKSSFFIWPVVRRMSAERVDNTLYRFNLFPLLINDSVVARESGEVTDKYFKLWPLVSYKRQGDAARLRVPDLWISRDLNGVERNLAPIWTLYSREKVNDAVDTELLWGLYRSRSSAGRSRRSVFPLYRSERDDENMKRKWDILYGLLGSEREGLRKTRKLLYFIKF